MPSPICLQFGSFEIRWYGVMIALGTLIGLCIMHLRRKQYSLTANQLADILLFAIVGGIVGARLFYVIRFWNEQFAGGPFWDVFKIWNGGLVFQGGFIIAAIAILSYCICHKLSIGNVGDDLAPALPIAHAFGRIGCLINGCCYGFTPYEGFCAIHYPGKSAGCFPTQAVEAIGNIIIAIIILLIERKQKAKGRLFLVYLMAYTVLRFLIEYLRGDYPEKQTWYHMTPGQYHALWQLPLIVLCFFVINAFVNKPKANPDSQDKPAKAQKTPKQKKKAK